MSRQTATSTRQTPHLGSLLARAAKPILGTLLFWMFLAIVTFWGVDGMSVRDAFAISYNDAPVIGLLLGGSLFLGSIQVAANLLPPLAEVLRSIGALLARPFSGLPLYTRRQIFSMLRLLLIGAVVFYTASSLRGSSIAARINAGISQLPIQLPNTVVSGLFFLLFFVLQFLMLFWVLSRGGVFIYLPEEISTGFESVWGQDHVVAKVREVVDFLKNPEQIEAAGGHVPGGVLLWGPPGTGKTLIAEAVAGETATPFVLVEPAAFQNMFVGVGVMRVRMLYRRLRKLAETYGGVVVFFDEADVLGSRPRAGGDAPVRFDDYVRVQRAVVPQTGGDLGVLNAILAAMQGVRTPRGLAAKSRRALGLPAGKPPTYRIMHMLATNMPSSLDPALLRPGRVDRIIKVGYPSRDGRLRTFQGYLAKISHELTEEEIETLATLTVNATGAIIKDIVNEALIAARRDDRNTVTWQDMLAAKRFKDFGPSEGVEYVPFERHAVAVHESCHALVAWRLRNHLAIDTVTIDKGQDFLGLVSSIPTEELFTRWKSEYRSDIAVALASLAGERLFFDGDSTSGVAGDLDQATKLASLMVTRWGMSGRISASHALEASGIPPAQEESRAAVEALLTDVFEEVSALIARDRHLVLALAHALEMHKSLSGADAMAILGLRKGPVLDGSIYDSPLWVEALEEYHQAMLGSRHGAATAPTPQELFSRIGVHQQGQWPEGPAVETEPTEDAPDPVPPLSVRDVEWPEPPLES